MPWATATFATAAVLIVGLPFSSEATGSRYALFLSFHAGLSGPIWAVMPADDH